MYVMASTLEKNVKYLDQQYRIGKATISDAAFDQLERNLQHIEPSCNYFTRKKKLYLPSIDSSNYREFLNTLLQNTRLSIQPKIDGCAIAIQYINGKFNKARTREGIDVKDKISQIKDVPLTIPIKRYFEVRGELFAPSKEASLSQSITSKYLKGKEKVKLNLSFCCFQILNGRLNQYETLNYLKKCGFTTPHSFYTNFTSQVEVFREQWLKGKLFSNYPTDGIVIKINSRKLQLIRETDYSHNKNWQYAIKN